MNKLPEDVKNKITKGVIHLLRPQPFFSNIAMHLTPIDASSYVPTIAVDADARLLVNVDFMRTAHFVDTQANPNEPCDVKFILCHEIMHLANNHFGRMPPGADLDLWNIACDITINEIIVDCGIPLPRKECILPVHHSINSNYLKYKGWVAEKIYYDLVKEKSEDNCLGEEAERRGEWWDDSASRIAKGSSSEEASGDDCPTPSAPMSPKQAAKWKQVVANAAVAAQQAGNMPGALGEFVTDLLAPKIDWRRFLRVQVASACKNSWTWMKPGRRTAGRIRTPGQTGFSPSAVAYIDTSGSMSDDLIKRCVSEVAEIFKQCGGKGWLILGDAEIYFSDLIDDVQALRHLPVQRGGTDFRVLFEEVSNLDTPPKILVGFTDLEGPFPHNPPDYPVVWVHPKGGAGRAPWGLVTSLEV
jgi:predicted metal-dependent peptidase